VTPHEEKTEMRRYIAEIAYLAGVLSVGVGLWLAQRAQWMKQESLKEEAFKLGLQVLVVGLLGGAVKLLLDQQEQQRNFRTEMLERLGRAHQIVYRVRRLYETADPGDASFSAS